MNAVSQVPAVTKVHAMPHNTEAEQQLLGAILSQNGLIDRVADVLRPEHFFDPLHGKIYQICQARIAANMIASPVTLRSILGTDEGLQQVGGAQYLVRMAGAAISSFAIREYAGIILDAAARRDLIRAQEDGVSKLRSGADVSVVQQDLIAALTALPEAQGAESSVSLLKAMTNALTQINEGYQGNVTFLKTGIDTLDAVLRGLGPSDYMLIGGATSMGKTALAVSIALNVARAGGKVGFWSLEMTEEQLAMRMASSVAGVPYSDLRDASTLSEAAFRRWAKAAESINKAPMRIVPKHVRDISAGEAALRRIKRELGGLDLALIDYSQLVRANGKTRYEMMTEVSIRSKALASALGCPLIGLVQLDRSIGERDDPRPGLADIKESGQFENDADQVVFCYREDYYLMRKGPRVSKDGSISTEATVDFEAKLAECRNKMQLLVRKNRHGRIADAEVGFNAATNRFWRIGDQQEGQMDGN